MDTSDSSLGNLFTQGLDARTKGNSSKAKEYFQVALAEAKKKKDANSEASALLYLSEIALKFDNDFKTARKLLKDSLQLYREISFARGEAYALNQLGTIDYHDGKLDDAQKSFNQAFDIFDRLQDKKGKATAMHQMGLIDKRKMNFAKAEQRFRECLLIFESLGDKLSIGNVLLSLGGISANHHQDWERARLLFSKALTLFEEIDAKVPIEKAKENLETLERLAGKNHK